MRARQGPHQFAADSPLEGRRFEPSVPGPLIRETRVSTLQPHALLHARAVGINQLAVVNVGGSLATWYPTVSRWMRCGFKLPRIAILHRRQVAFLSGVLVVSPVRITVAAAVWRGAA